jgi:hypothetical protein
MKLSTTFALAVLFWICALSRPVLAAPLTEAEIQQSVTTTLMNRHPDDTPEWWRKLGAQAPRILMRMYEADSSTYHRMRLIEGLSAFTDDPVALAFIKQQAERSPDDVIRNNAIRVVGMAQGAREEAFLTQFLAHEDPNTRIAAALALKKLGTSSASARVESFMAEEKTAWVLAKLKGESPKASGALLPSGSSEDRLSPDLGGVWHGFWVAPRLDQPHGMRSEAVELKLSLQAGASAQGGELGGEMKVRTQHKTRALGLSHLSGKGTHWSGSLVEEIAAQPKPRREETSFEAEMVQQAGSFLMQLKLARTGAWIYLRRDAATP